MPFMARWKPRPHPSRACAGDEAATVAIIRAAPSATSDFTVSLLSVLPDATRAQNGPFHELRFIIGELSSDGEESEGNRLESYFPSVAER